MTDTMHSAVESHAIPPPKVVDLFHGDKVYDWGKARAAGIVGVVHKATQGAAYADPSYAPRRIAARTAGLLWGAYHFGTGVDPERQAEHFLATAKPDSDTLVALDWEDHEQPMSIYSAREFLEVIDSALKRPTVIYSGNRLKELIADAAPEMRQFFGARQLWIPQYAPRVSLSDTRGAPLPWKKYFLWQYTGDGSGPGPHTVNGLGSPLDLNVFDGTDEELQAQWANPNVGE